MNSYAIKSALIAIGTVVASAFSFSYASAADMPFKAPVAVAPAFSWTGFYVGGSVGAFATNDTWNTSSFSTSSGVGTFVSLAGVPSTNTESFPQYGAQFGLHGGYNYQFSTMWVAGIEGDFAWQNSSAHSQIGIPGTYPTIALLGLGTTNSGAGDSSSVDAKWQASLRGRLGFLSSPTTMIYGTGGIAWQNSDYSVTCNGGAATSICDAANLIGFPIAGGPHAETVNKTRTGWTAGAGIETALFGSNWLARLEYRYADFGTFNYQFFSALGHVVNTSNQMQTHTATFGLSYKFGGR
jgi:outer membrane immunogenic protein